MTLKWYFYRWLRGPANIATGVAQTLTGGMYDPSWSFRAECKFLDVSEAEAVHNAELSGPRPLAAEGSRSNDGLCVTTGE